jgi:hypothetical protein
LDEIFKKNLPWVKETKKVVPDEKVAALVGKLN